MLSDERRRSNSDGQKINEIQILFAQVLKDYNSSIDNIRALQQEKRTKASNVFNLFCKYLQGLFYVYFISSIIFYQTLHCHIAQQRIGF